MIIHLFQNYGVPHCRHGGPSRVKSKSQQSRVLREMVGMVGACIVSVEAGLMF